MAPEGTWAALLSEEGHLRGLEHREEEHQKGRPPKSQALPRPLQQSRPAPPFGFLVGCESTEQTNSGEDHHPSLAEKNVRCQCYFIPVLGSSLYGKVILMQLQV